MIGSNKSNTNDNVIMWNDIISITIYHNNCQEFCNSIIIQITHPYCGAKGPR